VKFYKSNVDVEVLLTLTGRGKIGEKFFSTVFF